jgi:L-ascorbate metabolism protein UlaG (beta-lactamase superfamily)
MSLELVWLGHAGVMIRCPSGTLYIDPWKVSPKSPKADIILLTHEHYDHYSPDDLRLLKGESTRVIAPVRTPETTDLMAPGDRLSIGNIAVEAVAAYNISKAFHPRGNSWLGYVVEACGKRIYHAGDTDRVPEMRGLTVDVALLPVGGTYTMDAREAAMAAGDLKAGEAIPIHFGDIVGTRKDAETFARSCTAPVRILDPGEPYVID